MLGHAVLAAKAVQGDKSNVVIAVFQTRERKPCSPGSTISTVPSPSLGEGSGGVLARRKRDLPLIRDAACQNRHLHLMTLFASHVAAFHHFPHATCNARCLFHAITVRFAMKHTTIPYCIG